METKRNVAEGGDDVVVDLTDAHFNDMAIMPESCVNYMNEHMVKFEMFKSKNKRQCHSNDATGTFVVSISHYMRAYFNYRSLLEGANFNLPSDAMYLQCIALEQTTGSEQMLYAKIGCLERETYTSTKLWIHVYTDEECSQAYDDGQTKNQRLRKGYEIDGYYFNAGVSFHPSFFSCASCKPSSIADGFSMQATSWSDGTDDWIDDYVPMDDMYYKVQQYVNNEVKYSKNDDDDFYTNNDDNQRKLATRFREFTSAEGEREKFEDEFWVSQRELDNDGNNVQSWNMCRKIYKYGFWCDKDCRSLGHFRMDEWTESGIFHLVTMCVLMTAMMTFIFTERLKTFKKASIYADYDNAPDPGMPPLPMGLLFFAILCSIIILASLMLVNETLLITAICCTLICIWMLKHIFFETKVHVPQENSESHQIDYNYGGSSLFKLS